MHQSFATRVPTGPGNSRDIDFSLQSPGSICPALWGHFLCQIPGKGSRPHGLYPILSHKIKSIFLQYKLMQEMKFSIITARGAVY